jgi:O-antigen biosynthesis protein
VVRAIHLLRRQGIGGFLRILFHKARKVLSSSTIFQDEQYRRWIRENEPNSSELERQRRTNFDISPCVSIVVPVYAPPKRALIEMVQSVQAQTYPNWELCIAVAGNLDSEIHDFISSLAQKDQRVKLIKLGENKGIAGNTNAALTLAAGEYIAFLDQDDTLAPFALFEVVRCINEKQDPDLIYSDHDILNARTGRRQSPLFKPDWSPDILLSSNYITHLTVIKTAQIHSVGGLRAERDGAQDWDLFLRVLDQGARVQHIAMVLYHWRDSAGSTATNIYTKPYALNAQLRSIEDHLQRKGLTAPRAFMDKSGYIRVGWEPTSKGKVAILIPSRGVSPMLERCIESILALTRYPNFEILIVNNGSQKPEEIPAYQRMCQDARIRILHDDRPFNYSAANNLGVENTSSEHILFLNNDTVILEENWLDEMVMWASRSEIGAVGAKLLRQDGRIQHAGIVLGLTGFAGHIFAGAQEGSWTLLGSTEWYRDYLAVTAACLLVRRETYIKSGGLSEEFLLTGNDVEFGLRLNRLGYRVLYNPFVRLQHLEAATREDRVPAQDFRTSLRYYCTYLERGDPFYSPNLSHWELIPHMKKKKDLDPAHFCQEYVNTLDMKR